MVIATTTTKKKSLGQWYNLLQQEFFIEEISHFILSKIILIF